MFKTSLALAAASLGLAASAGHHKGQTRYAKGQNRTGRSYHPVVNLRSRTLHKHEREIARRLCQQERIAANRDARGGLSRRGRVISA